MPVGTNGCYRGTDSPATPLLTGPIRKGPGMPGAAREILDPLRNLGIRAPAGPHRYRRCQIAGLPHSRACSYGPPEGAAACSQTGLRAAGHHAYRHLRDLCYGYHRYASITPGGT